MARLVLEDGSEYPGIPFGAIKSTTGEVGEGINLQVAGLVASYMYVSACTTHTTRRTCSVSDGNGGLPRVTDGSFLQGSASRPHLPAHWQLWSPCLQGMNI